MTRPVYSGTFEPPFSNYDVICLKDIARVVYKDHNLPDMAEYYRDYLNELAEHIAKELQS